MHPCGTGGFSIDAAERPPRTEQPPSPGAFRDIEGRNARKRRGRRRVTAAPGSSEGGDGRLIVQASFRREGFLGDSGG